MPMHRWMARAAGGTSQRLNAGPATVRSLSSSPGAAPPRPASATPVMLVMLPPVGPGAIYRNTIYTGAAVKDCVAIGKLRRITIHLAVLKIFGRRSSVKVGRRIPPHGRRVGARIVADVTPERRKTPVGSQTRAARR